MTRRDFVKQAMAASVVMPALARAQGLNAQVPTPKSQVPQNTPSPHNL